MGRSRYVRIKKNDRFLIDDGSKLWILITLILISSTGCVPLDADSLLPVTPPTPTGTEVVLPATWTIPPPTVSITSVPAATPTITPTQTAAPSPTASIAAPQGSLEPSPTTDWTAVRLPDCTFTATDTGVRIHQAPFVDPYHVLPTMEPGKPYPAVLTNPTYSLLLDHGQPLGWVDYRLLVITSEGDECLTNDDEREFRDFPLCFFTPLKEINGYTDAEFENVMQTLAPPASFVVLYQSESYYSTAYGSSGPSFVVKKEEVYTHGNCDDIPTLAKATTETSLYTDLPDRGGSVVYTLEVDEPVFTQSQQMDGAPPPGVQGSGFWVLVRRHSWSEDINGWVWSEHIENK